MNKRRVDVAVVGFGFAGLATVAHLVRTRRPLSVAVISPEHSGLGLAYSTHDPGHLLNVRAINMGAWADAPGDFVNWLATASAVRTADRLGVSAPRANGYAARVLYAGYLDDLRDRTVRDADAAGIEIDWQDREAVAVVPDGERWSVETADGAVSAAVVVLGTGNEPRRLFRGIDSPQLYDGPWALSEPPANGPVALIGSGLTAVDALLSLRRLGYAGSVISLSRNGRLPKPHRPGLAPVSLTGAQVAAVRRLDDVLELIGSLSVEHDWRAVLDALRPYTAELWQRLPDADQRLAVERWGAVWGVHRHRMAPESARMIDSELAAGSFRVLATRDIEPTVRPDDSIELACTTRGGEAVRFRPSAVIDCSGSQLDCARSERPLLRQLIDAGIARPHHTGLGFAADADHQIAPRLFALGNLLTGQLWETIAIPELRVQAATIAARITGTPIPLPSRLGDGQTSPSQYSTASAARNITDSPGTPLRSSHLPLSG